MVLYLQGENQKMQTYFKKKDETAIFRPIFAKKNSPKKKTHITSEFSWSSIMVLYQLILKKEKKVIWIPFATVLVNKNCPLKTLQT